MVDVSERVFVPAPPEVVWGVLSHPEEVSECIPGATLEQTGPDGGLTGELAARFGPLRVSFTCAGTLVLDAESMTGVLRAQGRDGHGGARFELEARYGVDPTNGGSTVALHANVDLSGRLASVVESGVGMVVRQMTTEFGERLAERASRQPIVEVQAAPERPLGTVARLFATLFRWPREHA